jgi:plastocyanin
MKQTILLGTVIIAILLLVAGCASTQPPAQQPLGQQPPVEQPPSNTGPSGATTSVAIQNLKFMPDNAIIKQGTVVVWTNDDTVPHTVTFASFDSGTISPGSMYRHVFNDKGVFDYHCSIHPSMKGLITVN